MLCRIALSAALLAVAGAVTAQPPKSRPEPRATGTPTFSSYDADRDGRITRQEASTNVALIGQFERLDLDENDGIDEGEFARFEAEMDRKR